MNQLQEKITFGTGRFQKTESSISDCCKRNDDFLSKSGLELDADSSGVVVVVVDVDAAVAGAGVTVKS